MHRTPKLSFSLFAFPKDRAREQRKKEGGKKKKQKKPCGTHPDLSSQGAARQMHPERAHFIPTDKSNYKKERSTQDTTAIVRVPSSTSHCSFRATKIRIDPFGSLRRQTGVPRHPQVLHSPSAAHQTLPCPRKSSPCPSPFPSQVLPPASHTISPDPTPTALHSL